MNNEPQQQQQPEFSTDAQRIALEVMSATLVHKLNVMIAEQEERVRQFAAEHNALASLPHPQHQNPISYSQPETQQPEASYQESYQESAYPQESANYQAPTSYSPSDYRQPLMPPKPPKPPVPPPPPRRFAKLFRNAADNAPTPTIIKHPTTPQAKKSSDESSIGTGSIVFIIFVIIIIIKSCG